MVQYETIVDRAFAVLLYRLDRSAQVCSNDEKEHDMAEKSRRDSRPQKGPR